MRFLFLLCLLATISKVVAQDNLSALMPLPNTVKQVNGKSPFHISAATVLYANADSLSFEMEQLQKIITKRTGIVLKAAGKSSTNGHSIIRLLIDPSIQGREHYLLSVEEKQITIKGSTLAAIFYGIITLDQLLLGDVYATNNNKVSPVIIDDYPEYPFRALMLDPARNFLPVKDVKAYIDQMANYKYNVLQLHLTDDAGWRIEIKSHPRLTKVGAFRNPKSDDNGPDNGFYTQEQLKELVWYAAKRNIAIIPEIDVPGHTVAMLCAYPHLGSIATDTVFNMNKTVNKMLSAANETVYHILDDVLREVAAIFPAKMIHLGGDESAIQDNWAKSPENLQLMKKSGYNKPEQLMNIFFEKVLKSTKKYGLKVMLWCELDNIEPPAQNYLLDYPRDVTLISWRRGLTPKCIELTSQQGHSLILAPGEYCYFDYPQLKNDFPEFNNWGMPVTTLEQTYKLDPGYNLPKEQTGHILGVMGTLWGEAIKDIDRAAYMTWPRGMALAEAGWTKAEYRNWTSFKTRLYPNILNLMRNGVPVRAPFEIANESAY